MDGTVGLGNNSGAIPEFTPVNPEELQPDGMPLTPKMHLPPQDTLDQAPIDEMSSFANYYGATSGGPLLLKPKLYAFNPNQTVATVKKENNFGRNESVSLGSTQTILSEEIEEEEPIEEPAFSQFGENQTEELQNVAPSVIQNNDEVFTPAQNAVEFVQNAVVMTTEMKNSLEAMFNDASIPKEDRTRFMDFLKKVSDALLLFQKLLAEMSTGDAKGARERSKAQLELALTKIDEQRKQQEDIRKKEEKAEKKHHTMDKLSKVFGVFTAIITSIVIIGLSPILLLTPPAGWMVMSLLVTSLVTTCQKLSGKENDTAMSKLMEAFDAVAEGMTKAIDAMPGVKLSDSQKEALTLGLKTTLVTMSMIMMASACPSSFLLAPGAYAEFFGASDVMADIVKSAGGSDKQAREAQLYTGIAITAVAMILTIAVAFVAPSGAGSAVSAAVDSATKIAKAALQAAIRMLQTTLRISDKVAEAVTNLFTGIFRYIVNPENWMSISMVALQGVNTKASVDYYNLMGDLAKMSAHLEKDMEQYDAAILIIKKMIQKLLESMEGFTKEISNIGTLLQKNKDSLSQVITNLYG